jgi:molybdenum cofactor cytidylyltransferase
MIAAIVLAAGRSRRMGTQKLLLPWGDRPLIAHVVDQLLLSPVDRVLVVTGQDNQRIAQALAGRDVDLIINPDPASEMLDSVRCGLRAAPAQATAALVTLGDQPEITPELVARVVRAWHTSRRGIVVPTYQGRRGHPLLVSMDYARLILSAFDDCGLRGLLAAHPDDIQEADFPNAGVLEDIDGPEDYRRALGRQFK